MLIMKKVGIINLCLCPNGTPIKIYANYNENRTIVLHTVQIKAKHEKEQKFRKETRSKMFDGLTKSIIGPNPPWPFPPKEWDMRDVLILAVLYLTFLILTRGIAVSTAFTMASKKYGVTEDVLRMATRNRPWA